MSSVTSYDLPTWNSLEIVNNQVAVDKFNRLYKQARLLHWWNGLIGHPQTLLSYGQMQPNHTGHTGVDTGIREIPIKSIVGSVERAGDYDPQFRPLNPALKSRWIKIHMLTVKNGWKPIVVHKIGDQYFVLDGHHRVSVARHSGWKTIEAQVFE